jgi:hypothetical protein
MAIFNAKNLSLNDVHHLLKLQEQLNNGSFTTWLSLEPVTDFEQQEIVQIRNDFRHYILAGKVYEGLVKALTSFPLLRLTGFYRYPIQISLEEDIADINVTDEDTIITGRFDILAVNKATPTTTDITFWILVIEAKNSAIEVRQGLPQLLTYAFKRLDGQASVWGLATNGLQYLFVHLSSGNPPTYQLMPELHLMDTERSIQLLQVLKAICCQLNTGAEAI